MVFSGVIVTVSSFRLKSVGFSENAGISQVFPFFIAPLILPSAQRTDTRLGDSPHFLAISIEVSTAVLSISTILCVYRNKSKQKMLPRSIIFSHFYLTIYRLASRKNSTPCFLHNNFQNPIVIKWIPYIDHPLECFVRIIAVMVDVFRLSPERKLMNAPFANEEHLNYCVIHVAVI